MTLHRAHILNNSKTISRHPGDPTQSVGLYKNLHRGIGGLWLVLVIHAVIGGSFNMRLS